MTIIRVVISASLAGCQPALVNLDVPESGCPECECKLPPLPKKAKIELYGTGKFRGDAAGRILLERYIHSREIIQDLWQEH